MEETKQKTEPDQVDEPSSEGEQVTEKPAVKQRSPRRKVAELEEAIAALKVELEQEVDRRLRVMAEYENYRRRTQAEFGQMIQEAGERIIRQLLPVMDDFERLFNNELPEGELEALRRGVELIYKKLDAVLAAEGLQPIAVLNQQFDADIHEAVAQVDDPSHPAGTVVAEVEKGYRLGDKIIRHPRVIVSNVPEEDSGDAGGQ